MKAYDKREKRIFFSYLLILVSIGCSIVLVGYPYHKNFEKHFKDNVENQLSLIARSKVDELNHWREERKDDAKTILGNEVFSKYIKRYFKNPGDSLVKREIKVWMKEFQTGFDYNAVILTDLQLIRRIIISKEAEPPSAKISANDIGLLKSGELVYTDFYKSTSKQKVFLKILLPILDLHQLIGIVELRIDPQTYLYSILAHWATPGESSELFILRREGNHAVYLSELKFQKNAILNLRIPLENTNLPGVKAILGSIGFVEGIDYRGKAVVAYVDKVPNSPWYVVAKSDKSEVYALIRDDLLQTVIFGIVMFLLGGLGLAFLWKNQRAILYKARIISAEALRDSEERFRSLYENSAMGIYRTTPEGKIILANDTLIRMLGYSSFEDLCAIDLNKEDYESNYDRKQFVEQIETNGEIIGLEAHWTKKDGTPVFIRESVRAIRDLNYKTLYYDGTVEDISELKKSELERQVIYEITEGVSTTGNLNELLGLIHHSLGKALYAENIFIALYDQDKELFSFPYYVDQFDTTPEPAKMDKSCSAYIFRTGKPLLITPEVFQQLKEQHEVELVGTPSPSWIGIPLQTPARTLGILVLQHYEKENVYTERDVQFLDSVGSQIALAVERKQIDEAVKREMDFSQRSLNSLPGLFYLFDDQGKFLRWNKNFEITTGYSAEEIEHLSPLDLFDEPDKTSIEEKIQQVFQIGEASVEADLVSKDRTKTSIFFTGKRFQFENKQCMAGMGIDISDRRHAEEDLRNAHLLLRTVIDNIPDSIYCKDSALRKTLANNTELSYSGANSEADIIGKTDFDLYPSELAEGFQADDQLVIQKGLPVINREEFIIDSSGEKHWLLTSKLPIKDEFGTITGLVGIGRDITARRQAEEDLRESEIKLNVILQSTADGILAVDGVGKVIKTNRRFAELWNIPQALIDSGEDDTLISFVLEQLINPEEFISKVEKLYRSTDEDLDYLHFKDGRTFERFSAPMVMGDSSVGRVWSFRDITERKLAEESLQKLNLAIHNSKEVVFITDTEGVISYINPEFTNMHGYIAEEVVGKATPRILNSGLYPKEVSKLLWDALLNKQIVPSSEYVNKCKDGKLIDIEGSATPILNTNGDIIGFLGVQHDITGRKQTEQEIKETIQRLLQAIAEKDKFFSIIAHDLRGPFSGFLGLTQVMAEELPSLTMAEIQELAVSMKNSASNLYSLLENLLKWSQIQKGTIPFSPEAIQLKPVIDESIAVAFATAQNKGIEINCTIHEGVEVFADSNMLQTVIRNLVSNALKFTPKGGEVSVSAKVAGDKSVEISVRDSGIGMNQTMIDNLFRPDVRTNRKGTDDEPSTGLGLLLCKEFVEKNNGKLWVKSEVNHGSTFHFTLPGS